MTTSKPLTCKDCGVELLGGTAMNDIDYTKPAPDDYCCHDCGATGVKLWRPSHTFVENVELRCRECSLDREGKQGHGDAIGGLVPAVPTEDGETFWGYSSVPLAGVVWWYRLDGTAKAASRDPEIERLEYCERQLGNAIDMPQLFQVDDVAILFGELRRFATEVQP